MRSIKTKDKKWNSLSAFDTFPIIMKRQPENVFYGDDSLFDRAERKWFTRWFRAGDWKGILYFELRLPV